MKGSGHFGTLKVPKGVPLGAEWPRGVGVGESYILTLSNFKSLEDKGLKRLAYKGDLPPGTATVTLPRIE